MQVKIKRLHPDAVIPTYSTSGAACFDISALTSIECYPHEFISTTFKKPSAGTFRTGLSFEIPSDHVMLVFSRSGHGFKNDVRLANCVGVIDSDYRGELMVRMTKDGGVDKVVFNKGDRIAQAMILPVQQVQFLEVDELGVTERGEGGFGSTGK